MIKKILTRIGILSVVFVIAVVVFSYMTNQGNTGMSVDMGAPELPRISFVTGEYKVNALPGYEEDMNIPTMRDTVTPLNGGKIHLQIDYAKEPIEKMTWQVFTLDGEECLKQETVNEVTDVMEIFIQGNGILAEERVLKLTLHLEERDVYYYTRIKSDNECNYEACMDYVKAFHENTFEKSDIEKLQNAIETNAAMGGSGFHKVNIYSSLERVTWGNLKPVVISDVGYEVKECNETYSSIMLSYRVSLPEVEDDADAIYSVKEFFRVRFWGEKVYLLDYEREMNQVFDGNKKALDEKGILLGIAPSEIDYLSNEDGTIVSFVQNQELWNYDKEADALSLVFSFADAEGMDERNLYDQHEIRLIEIEENGNTVFTVTGYMNRGRYEGRVGVAVYYFDSEKNSVEEKAFVPSRKGYQIMREELGKNVYYSNQTQNLYIMLDGTLYVINLEEDTREVLVRGLEDGQYKVSEDGSVMAYQSMGGKLHESQTIRILNLENGKQFEVTSSGEEYIQPIGFIKSDFAYGYLKQENVTTSLAGETIYPIHKVEIVNQEEKVVKTYEVPDVFVTGYYIEGNMLTLERMSYRDGMAVLIADDHITNNEEVKESNIYLESYTSGEKGLQMRIVYDYGISDAEAKILNPKQVLKEHPLILNFDQAGVKERYYVYAFGKLQGIYEKESQAIAHAEKLEGVAVTYKQAYLWEKGNWPNVYEVDDMIAFTKTEGESSLAACIERILAMYEVDAEVQKELESGVTPKDILTKYSGGEGLNLTGCTIEQMLYTISRETPVIALTGEGRAVLLAGYNKTNVLYLDPTSGERKSVSRNVMQDWIEASGSVLIGYAR